MQSVSLATLYHLQTIVPFLKLLQVHWSFSTIVSTHRQKTGSWSKPTELKEEQKPP